MRRFSWWSHGRDESIRSPIAGFVSVIMLGPHWVGIVYILFQCKYFDFTQGLLVTWSLQFPRRGWLVFSTTGRRCSLILSCTIIVDQHLLKLRSDGIFAMYRVQRYSISIRQTLTSGNSIGRYKLITLVRGSAPYTNIGRVDIRSCLSLLAWYCSETSYQTPVFTSGVQEVNWHFSELQY